MEFLSTVSTVLVAMPIAIGVVVVYRVLRSVQWAALFLLHHSSN